MSDVKVTILSGDNTATVQTSIVSVTEPIVQTSIASIVSTSGTQASAVTSSDSTQTQTVTIDPSNLDTLTLSDFNSLKNNNTSLITATGNLQSNVVSLTGATGELQTSVTTLNSATGELTGSIDLNLTRINTLSGTINTNTGDIFFLRTGKLDNFNPKATGLLNLTGLNQNGLSFHLDGGRALITPKNGVGLHLKSNSTFNQAVSAKVEGPVTVTHDLFKDSGQTSGFADSSNHFHSIYKINNITQNGINNNLNLERLQERYYAVTGNLVRNKAAFLTNHRVARPIGLTNQITERNGEFFDSDNNPINASIDRKSVV